MAKSSKHPEPRNYSGAHSATGGELQQQAGAAPAALTNNQGLDLSDNQKSLRAIGGNAVAVD